MAHFDLLPPKLPRWDAGAVVSLVIHAALAAPLIVGHATETASTDPFEQLVVYLLPPDREVGRQSPGKGVDWSGLVGTGGGATIDPLPIEPHAETSLELGVEGDTAVTRPEAPMQMSEPETALTEIEVDSVVARDPTSTAPVYPADLLAKRIEGGTFVNYVVDTTGRVDTLTIQVIRSTHPAFEQSVREALAMMKFRPAIQASKRVRQWVQQNFSFRILDNPATPNDTT